jgi:hypothetical protein
MGNTERTAGKPRPYTALGYGSWPLDQSPSPKPSVKEYDLSDVSDRQLLDEMRKRGILHFTVTP